MMLLNADSKMSFGRLARLLAIGLLVVLAGCVQQYPVAYYAHPGSTIILGIGGIQRNVSGTTNLQASDLTITITDSNNTVTPLTPVRIFKAFPDYSSGLTNLALGNANGAGLVVFDGGWFVSVLVPSSFAPGSYTISITSPTNKLTNTKNCFANSCEGDLTHIALQVEAIPSGLEQQYASQDSSYPMQFTYYPSQSGRLDVSPSPAPVAGSPAVGGLQLVINFPAANYTGTTPVIALPYSHNPAIQLAQNILDTGDGVHKSLVVLLSSSQGFATGANRTQLMPRLSDLSLSFLYVRANGIPSIAAQQLADFQIDQSHSKYYDTNGNVITTMSPNMTFLQ